MAEEIIDIVDENNCVIGCACRDEVDEKKHCHRIVHVLIFNAQGEMALQIRSKTKSFAPGYYSTSVGGYVQSGESYEEAAIREAKEEIGIALSPDDLEVLCDDYYVDAIGNRKFLRVYKAAPYEGPFTVDTEEVESVVFMPVTEVINALGGEGKFHPELANILLNYFK